MTTPNTPTGILRDAVPVLPKGRVWGVRDYHTTLEQRAIAGAAMSWGYVSMTLAAAVMATAGLLLNSPAAVIGSMCVAPFIAPSRAVCIGALFRQSHVLFGGLVKQLIGMLVISVSVATIITAVLHHSTTGITITPEILLRAMPTTRDVVLSALIALSAGAAASLALVTHPHIVETAWGQAVDAIIGVEIAISLVPPAAVIGIGLALGTPAYSRNALYLLLLNVVCLDLVGSSLILALWGVRRNHLDLEKSIRSAVAVTLGVVPGFISVGSTVHVTLLGNHEALVDVILRRQFGGEISETLAAKVAADIAAKTSCRSDVTVEVIPVLTHAGIPR
ncbi:MAG: DUF389 domain-containing protein [Candidatus Korobacteraceae bacterium]